MSLQCSILTFCFCKHCLLIASTGILKRGEKKIEMYVYQRNIPLTPIVLGTRYIWLQCRFAWIWNRHLLPSSSCYIANVIPRILKRILWPHQWYIRLGKADLESILKLMTPCYRCKTDQPACTVRVFANFTHYQWQLKLMDTS